jgi:hypothetical protein
MQNHPELGGIIMGSLVGLIIWGIIITVGAAL